MSTIIPAILPTSREDLEDKLWKLQGVSTSVQIDLVDGSFGAPKTWLGGDLQSDAAVEKPLPFLGTMAYEVDIMARDPEPLMRHFVREGVTRVTVHAALILKLPEFIANFQREYGHDKDFAPGLLSLGLAIGIDTDMSLIEPYIEQCDYVQFMGIAHIGKQGEPFDTRVLPKIAAFRKKYPEMPIQVDGGVSLTTAPSLLTAGVSRIVVGSAFWNAGTVGEQMEKFEELTQIYS